MSTADDIADQYLLQGHVTIRRVTQQDLLAIVKPERDKVWIVRWRKGSKGWSCSCERLDCAHLMAVKTVVAPEVDRV